MGQWKTKAYTKVVPARSVSMADEVLPPVTALSVPLKDRLGWKPGPKVRSEPFKVSTVLSSSTLPASVDLRTLCPKVYDQLSLGSCTAQAGAALFEVLRKKQGLPTFLPSRLFIYYNQRVVRNSVSDDSGSTLTDCINVLTEMGAAHDSLWWYNPVKFAVKPNRGVYADGAKYKLIKSLSVSQNLDEMRGCLASGFPFVFGFRVYSSFANIRTNGMMPLPNLYREEYLGGHAVMAVGYDNAKKVIIVRNSWSDRWGDKGYFYMPYNYIIDSYFCDDFWMGTSVM